jgi:hypothetical protein
MMAAHPQLSLAQIAQALPEQGLFGAGAWRWSPQPLVLPRRLLRELDGLGHILAQFQRASDAIYRRSAKGKLPAWIAESLDRGKPDWLIAAQRRGDLASAFPRIIRPDLLLTEKGFSLTEIDSVPGGIGITAWLSQQYAAAGCSVLGGARGMTEGFSALLPAGGAIMLAEEAADYRPEMEWLLGQLDGDRAIEPAESLRADDPRSLYRFFECFDWNNIPALPDYAAGNGKLEAPLKPHLEEKLWLALYHMPGLRALWKKELRAAHDERLQQLIPESWFLRPVDLPADAVLPGLNVPSWQDVADFSQKERQLVIKISGFDPTAWGSRGVFIGHDLPAQEWQDCLARALADRQRAWIMQRFCETLVIEHPIYQPDGSIVKEKGRVRLCPYYFTDAAGLTRLHGCLATIVPVDKKKIHGMSDGVLTVVAADAAEDR